MNREFFEHICSFAGLEKNVNNMFIEKTSSIAFSLESDGIHILGRMNNELLSLINNEISIGVDDNIKQLDNNKQDYRIVELKLTAPTIMGSVNLLSIIEIIKKYYLDIKRNDIKNYYQKIYTKERLKK